MSRESKLVKNTFILAVGTFFPKLAIFVTLPILTACLNKTDYGVYDLTITMVALILPVATLQVQTAAFRFLIDVRQNKKEIAIIITTICLFVIGTSLLALAVVFILLRNQPILVSIGICAYYFFDILNNMNRQIVRGLAKNIDYSISAIISGIGQICLIALVLLELHKGLIGCLFALVASEGISMLYLLFKGEIYSYIKIKSFNRYKLKELLAYSWPMVPNSLSQWVIHSSDRLVITAFMGIQANAVYSVAYKIPSILSLAQTTFNMAWQENASISANAEDVKEYYSSMFTWLFNIVAGMMSALIGFTPVLFLIIVRGDYSEAYNQIPILFMGIFFLCLSTFWGGIFVALKQTRVVGTTTVIAAAINLGLDLLLVNYIGLYAGSISSVVAYLSMCLLRARSINKYIKISYNYKHVLIVITCLVIQCCICFLQIAELNIINFVIGIIICIMLNWKIIIAVWNKIFSKK